jgi:lipopolysaccharide heptosyltransferase II
MDATEETAATSPAQAAPPLDTRPILIVPYMWIGDFVRCHTAVRLINARFPDRPVDMLTTARTLPLIDYMPGVRKGIVSDLPRGRLALAKQWELARRLKAEGYGSALVMPRTWKSALAPFLAAIPKRTGFAGEGRLVLLNDLRWGERRLERMIDRKVALTLPGGTALPASSPLPSLVVPAAEVSAWRARRALSESRVVALCPATVGPGRRWPVDRYGELARALVEDGIAVWVLGSPDDRPLATEIAKAGGSAVRDLTGEDLRDAVLALAAADAAVANDSGLLHVAAALDTPAVGIFGPSRPHLTGPLNPLAAAVEPSQAVCPTCGRKDCTRLDHRRTEDIPVEPVLEAVRRTLERAGAVAAR